MRLESLKNRRIETAVLAGLIAIGGVACPRITDTDSGPNPSPIARSSELTPTPTLAIQTPSEAPKATERPKWVGLHIDYKPVDAPDKEGILTTAQQFLGTLLNFPPEKVLEEFTEREKRVMREREGYRDQHLSSIKGVVKLIAECGAQVVGFNLNTAYRDPQTNAIIQLAPHNAHVDVRLDKSCGIRGNNTFTIAFARDSESEGTNPNKWKPFAISY